VFLEKIFTRFFPRFFGHDIRVFIKKTCFRTFSRRFFSIVFSSRYTCVSGKKFFSRFFPPFFCHDIRVFIKKNVFSHFLHTIFFQHFLDTLIVYFLKFFSRFSPPFFDHVIRVFIKNVISHFYQTIFLHRF